MRPFVNTLITLCCRLPIRGALGHESTPLRPLAIDEPEDSRLASSLTTFLATFSAKSLDSHVKCGSLNL
jgi:hypothetical protein